MNWTRRDALRALGAGSTAALVGCGPRHVRPSALTAPAARRTFAKVQVSRDRIIRTVTGLRPFRPSGFVVRGEKMGAKTVVHNYGHGGGGVTLSWGTASLAVEEAAKTGATRMAVLGCGAVGLATARLLQQRGIQTTIYAKDLPPSTTSNIAGAQWFPTTVYDRDRLTPAFVDQFARASRFSYRWYQTMVGDYYGIRWIPNYICSREPFFEGGLHGQQSPIRDVIPEMHDLAAAENPFPYPYVRQFTTMLIEPPVYLNAVLRDFRIAGGTVTVQDFASVEQILELPEPVIVNCTGLGAKALFKDAELIPIKGQLTFLLPQPEVDYVTMSDGLYMFPRRDGILLGGTHERDVWNLEPDRAAEERILAAHAAFFAAMR